MCDEFSPERMSDVKMRITIWFLGTFKGSKAGKEGTVALQEKVLSCWFKVLRPV
jgi:hypothetical protein